MLAAILAVTLASEPLPGVNRVLILGDSITAAGYYTAYLEGYFAVRFPDREIEFINLGLPSETISGLSEPSHPWPRPNVHERLDRALDMLKPDVVFACYGMNDGIYHPFSEERFAAYRRGIKRLVDRCKDRKLPLYLITPPPFDGQPIRDKLKGEGATDFGWMAPYEKYQEEVLARYGTWVKRCSEKGVATIDAQQEISDFLTHVRTIEKHPEYQLADDGVHMSPDGHWLIARAILAQLRPESSGDIACIDAKSLRATRGDVKDLKAEAGGLSFRWTTRLPMPEDPAWSAVLRESGGRLDEHRLVVDGLRPGRYTLYEGSLSVGAVDVKEATTIIDLRKFPEVSTNLKADQLGQTIRKRERIMSPAWRDHVGHKRPDTEKGLTLDEAKKLAEPLSAEILRLRKPVTLELSLRAN